MPWRQQEGSPFSGTGLHLTNNPVEEIASPSSLSGLPLGTEDKEID